MESRRLATEIGLAKRAVPLPVATVVLGLTAKKDFRCESFFSDVSGDHAWGGQQGKLLSVHYYCVRR